MNNTLLKAPILINRKPTTANFYILDADIFEMAGKELGYPSFKILMVLIGTKDGFGVSEEWICRRAATSTKNYAYRDRKDLVEKGYIKYNKGCGSITIDYENISTKLVAYKSKQNAVNSAEKILPIFPQGEEKNNITKIFPKLEEKIPQGAVKIPQVEEKIPQVEEKIPQGEGYNRETDKQIRIDKTDIVNPSFKETKTTEEKEKVEYTSELQLAAYRTGMLNVWEHIDIELKNGYSASQVADALNKKKPEEWQKYKNFRLLHMKSYMDEFVKPAFVAKPLSEEFANPVPTVKLSVNMDDINNARAAAISSSSIDGLYDLNSVLEM